jgi:hypothetical protein
LFAIPFPRKIIKKDAYIGDKLAVRFLNFLGKLVANSPLKPPATNGNIKLIFSTWGIPELTMFSGMTADAPVKNWGDTGHGLYLRKH